MNDIRVLLDTNIFIYREDNRVIPEHLQELLQLMSTLNIRVLIHPMSVEDIERDLDTDRMQISLSKLGAYAHLISPPRSEQDNLFIAKIGPFVKPNDKVDSELLYAVYKDAVHLLVTEDSGIRKKASKLGLAERVLGILDAQALFSEMMPNDSLDAPPLIEHCPVHNLDINDPFFCDLKRDYNDFTSWFTNISREGRNCYVYFKSKDRIGALLIYKDETESIDSMPPLPLAHRLKLCTFKVEETGYRLGELFIKLAVEYSLKNDIQEIYLTHISKGPHDELEKLNTDYGFSVVATKGRENILLKKLVLSKSELTDVSPQRISSIWPAYCDTPDVQKIVVPIQPIWHDRLFVNFPYRHPSLFDLYDFIIEGNAIEKAYLSHSPMKNLLPGAILLFYRSKDIQSLTTLGVVKEAYLGLSDPDAIFHIVRKRTVYRHDEIEDIAEKPTNVILFTWNCYLERPIPLRELINAKILRSAPRSMHAISHEQYIKILEIGEIDERLVIH